MSAKGAIPIQELKERICALLDHVKSVHGETLDLDEDFYWEVSADHLYKVTEDPVPPEEIGSLYEDWEMLSKLKGADYPGPALMLTKAAPLLRYISGKVGV